MLRSLWGGVSGMQAHQVGLDVTSNNIANVNTVGYKYSRANFSDMLYQTQAGASMPYGGRGGTDPYTIGLGGEVNSTTRIHKQGSMKTTNFQGDLAIDGNGFFIVSGDGGNTRALTRDGRFKFDAQGNFVNNAGFVVQGWVRNISSFEKTAAINENVVDTAGPITSIKISPKLVMPARATTSAQVSVNLTSSDKTDQLNFAYALDSNGHTISSGVNVQYDSRGNRHQVAENMGTLFSTNGEAMKLKQGQGIWVSYKDAELNFKGPNPPATGYGNSTQSVVINGEKISFVNNSNSTNIATRDAAITAINNAQDKTGIKAYAKGSTGIQLINTNSIDGDSNTKNIRIDAGSIRPPANADAFFNQLLITQENFTGTKLPVANGIVTGVLERKTAFRYQYTEQSNVQLTSKNGRIFHSTEDLRRWMQYDANVQKNSHVITGATGGLGTSAATPITISNYSIPPASTGLSETLSPWKDGGTLADPYGNSGWARLNSVSVVMNQYGQFEMVNKFDGIKDDDPNSQVQGRPAHESVNNLKITIANYQTQKTPSNVLFGQMMKGISTGNLVEGGGASATSSFKVPKLTTINDIYDSLGNKHTLQIEFRKIGDLEWSFSIKLPEPAEIVGAAGDVRNVLQGGKVTFNRVGGLQSVQPNQFSFMPLNGAEGPQRVNLDFGQNALGGDFKGITGTAEESGTRGFTQNGWSSGTLQNWQFDSNGVLSGKFTNGRSIALAQVALGTVDNEMGLESVGGNLYLTGANSGDINVGVANRLGNGTIKPSSYEMSTADLSEELTQLIVIQRGYQANAKTVTTSDQILNTLLGLKQ